MNLEPKYASLLELEGYDNKSSQQYYDDGNKSATAISLHSMSKEYRLEYREEVVVALRDINLTEQSAFPPIGKGEFVIVRGPSGGGKTTLLNMIGTLDVPSCGWLEILGQRVDSSSSDNFLADLRLSKIGFVFQTFNLISTMSAFENVELPMAIAGKLTPAEQKSRALELLELVGLIDRVEHLPSELSGGEQQRVTIARSLANKPEILLLDEPTGDLDTLNTLEIMNLLLEVNQVQGTTLIMVTHNADLECYANRILYIADGMFTKQALNMVQTQIDYEEYMKYLTRNEKD